MTNVTKHKCKHKYQRNVTLTNVIQKFSLLKNLNEFIFEVSSPKTLKALNSKEISTIEFCPEVWDFRPLCNALV